MEKFGEMHGFHGEDNITELYTRMLGFIGSSIGPGAAVKGEGGN